MADWLQAGGGSVTTSARSSLPALLCAELGYNLRFHWGYLDAASQTTSSSTIPSTSTDTQARQLSLRPRGRYLRLGLGLELGLLADPGFQSGQRGLEGGRG